MKNFPQDLIEQSYLQNTELCPYCKRFDIGWKGGVEGRYWCACGAEWQDMKTANGEIAFLHVMQEPTSPLAFPTIDHISVLCPANVKRAQFLINLQHPGLGTFEVWDNDENDCLVVAHEGDTTAPFAIPENEYHFWGLCHISEYHEPEKEDLRFLVNVFDRKTGRTTKTVYTRNELVKQYPWLMDIAPH